MNASFFVNLALGVSALAAVGAQIRKSSLGSVMKYFTSLSNVFCGLAGLCVAVCRLTGDLPPAAAVFKYMGTVTLMVTMLTVIFFLTPQYGLKPMFGGADLWLHLLCPLLALVSWLAWDSVPMPFSYTALGVLPVVLYGILYLRKAVADRSESRWEDFYGFNKTGKWPVSFAVMLLATFLISAALWAL